MPPAGKVRATRLYRPPHDLSPVFAIGPPEVTRARTVPPAETMEFHKILASSLDANESAVGGVVRVGRSRGSSTPPLPLAEVSGRLAPLITPQELEPDRAGSRHDCSLVPLLACVRNAADASSRHFTLLCRFPKP